MWTHQILIQMKMYCPSHARRRKLPVQCFLESDKELKLDNNYYDDGVWYKGTLVNFDVSNGQWKVEFDDDEEEAFVKFRDEDIHLLDNII